MGESGITGDDGNESRYNRSLDGLREGMVL